LLQLYASLLVNRINDQRRKQASIDDLAPVEEQVLSQGAYYFRYVAAPPLAAAREALEALARGESPILEPSVRRWLLRRSLITPGGELAIPVLGTFIRHTVLA
jgi:hypothetical protein